MAAADELQAILNAKSDDDEKRVANQRTRRLIERPTRPRPRRGATLGPSLRLASFETLELLSDLVPGHSRHGSALMRWLDESEIVEVAGLQRELHRVARNDVQHGPMAL